MKTNKKSHLKHTMSASVTVHWRKQHRRMDTCDSSITDWRYNSFLFEFSQLRICIKEISVFLAQGNGSIQHGDGWSDNVQSFSYFMLESAGG